MDITSLEMTGSEGFELKNTFFSLGKGVQKLAILFPGAGYTCDMPALYYPRNILLSRGFDVLALEYSFQSRGLHLSPEVVPSVLVDSENAVQAVLKEKDYNNFVLVGKSLGTRVLSSLMVKYSQLTDAKAIYLTPVFSQGFNQLTAQVKQEAIMVIGTDDQFYNPEMINELKKNKEFKLIVLEGADHGLEIKGDWSRSIKFLKIICEEIEKFIKA